MIQDSPLLAGEENINFATSSLASLNLPRIFPTVYILFSPQQVPRLDVASSINPARSSLVQGLRESQGERQEEHKLAEENIV